MAGQCWHACITQEQPFGSVSAMQTGFDGTLPLRNNACNSQPHSSPKKMKTSAAGVTAGMNAIGHATACWHEWCAGLHLNCQRISEILAPCFD